MKDLIAKLEAATEGSRELDGVVMEALGFHVGDSPMWINGLTGKPVKSWLSPDGKELTFVEETFCDPKCKTYGPPRYTTSLDAALTLVPDETKSKIIFEEIIPSKFREMHGSRLKGRHVAIWRTDGTGQTADGATDCLALCIAALKARSA